MSDHTGKGFIWYDLVTTDLDAAKAFYSSVVGWQVHDSGIPGRHYELLGVAGKSLGGMVAIPDASAQKPMWIAHIYAPDVDAAAAAVVEHGGSLMHSPQDIPKVGRFAVARDPQGVTYLLFQPHENAEWEPPAANAVGNVGWHELATTDWEGAWRFYSDLYGWTKHMTIDMGAAGTYQTFMLTGTQGGGMMNLSPAMLAAGATPLWTYYITVESIEAAKQRVLDGGGSVTHGPCKCPVGRGYCKPKTLRAAASR